MDIVSTLRDFVNPPSTGKLRPYQFADLISARAEEGSLLATLQHLLRLLRFAYPAQSDQSWCSEKGARKLLEIASDVEKGCFPQMGEEDIDYARRGLMSPRYSEYLLQDPLQDEVEVEADFFPPSCDRGGYASYSMEDVAQFIHDILDYEMSRVKNPYNPAQFLRNNPSPASREYAAISMIVYARYYFMGFRDGGTVSAVDDWEDWNMWCNDAGREFLLALADYFLQDELPFPTEKEVLQLRQCYLPERYKLILEGLMATHCKPRAVPQGLPLIKVGFGFGERLRLIWMWRGSRARGSYRLLLAGRLLGEGASFYLPLRSRKKRWRDSLSYNPCRAAYDL